MARFNIDTADNYGGQSNGSFFTLKDDKDTARVRFLYNTIDDVEGYSVHRVKVGDKERYVNCIREYSDPIEQCPFCKAQLKIVPRLFIKLYNVDAGEVQIWERSKAYFQRLDSLAARYNPLCNEVVEVERNGKKGDMKTTYEFYPVENSEVNLSDYDDVSPLGTIILEKTAEQMEEYLEIGDFMDDTAATVSNARSNLDELPRRTPNNSGRRAF